MLAAIDAGSLVDMGGTTDKAVERLRYDSRAHASRQVDPARPCGVQAVPVAYRAPYEWYHSLLAAETRPGVRALELAAGTGEQSMSLVSAGARLVAVDISHSSLQVLRHRLGAADVWCVVADLEALPFSAASFDIVACAGSLSYGSPWLVEPEILRVITAQGTFLSVDSMNDNPLYRANRWIRYLRGERTKSTLRNMPTFARLMAFASAFCRHELRFFGAASYLMPAVAAVVGGSVAAQFSDWIDRRVTPRRSAYRFVMVGRGLRASSARLPQTEPPSREPVYGKPPATGEVQAVSSRAGVVGPARRAPSHLVFVRYSSSGPPPGEGWSLPVGHVLEWWTPGLRPPRPGPWWWLGTDMVAGLLVVVGIWSRKALVVRDSAGAVVHVTAVLGRDRRFPFMDKQDATLGVWTAEACRGLGIARGAVNYVVRSFASEYRSFWYVTGAGNRASVRLAERCGFLRHGTAVRTAPCGLRALGSYLLWEAE